MAKNLPTYDVIHKKTRNPKLKNFVSLPTRRLAKPFEGWNRSLPQSNGELVAKWHENSSSMHYFKVRYIRTPAANMLITTVFIIW